jgi:hypothetical protein
MRLAFVATRTNAVGDLYNQQPLFCIARNGLKCKTNTGIGNDSRRRRRRRDTIVRGSTHRATLR